MAFSIPPPPVKQKIERPDGSMDSGWSRWFQLMWQQAAGITSTSSTSTSSSLLDLWGIESTMGPEYHELAPFEFSSFSESTPEVEVPDMILVPQEQLESIIDSSPAVLQWVKDSINTGTVILVAGTATVSTTAITANTRILLTVQGGTLTNVGSTYISARTPGTSFVISSSNILDTSTVAWFMIEAA